QVLDDGRLTDGQGRTVDFSNTVIIMTSNLGSERIQALSGEHNYAAMKAAVMEIVTFKFKPEFINRIDETVVFKPLGKVHIRTICQLQIQILSARLAIKDLTLALSNDVLDLLGASGFDPVYGGRPLKREIQQQIENPLAEKLLAGEYVSGDTIHVTLKDQCLHFS
ncbi:MAG: AAA family ATPase, partial [Methylococcales bacterium]|nr:AAA family ATPase [Methylococcales bacterium]